MGGPFSPYFSCCDKKYGLYGAKGVSVSVIQILF